MTLTDGSPLLRSASPGAQEQNAAVHRYRIDTSLMLCIACGLIVNSHLERFWPRPFLAIDGLLGNSFFYLMSGIGIGSSLFKRPQRFGPFLCRRIARIYPAVIITVVLFIGVISGRCYTTADGVAPWTFKEAFSLLVWPTPFTYVRNIVAIYTIGYLVALPRSRAALFVGLVTAIVLFLYCSISDSYRLASDAKLSLGSLPVSVYDSFDTALFIGGMIVAGSRIARLRHLRTNFILTGAVSTMYFILKYLMVVKGVGAQFYPVLFVVVGVLSYLAIGVLSAPVVILPLRRFAWIGWIIDMVAGLSLEIYVLHQMLISTFADLAAIQFPLNIVLLVFISVAVAPLLRLLTAPVRRLVNGMTGPSAAVERT